MAQGVKANLCIEVVRNLYVDERNSVIEMADILGVSQSTCARYVQMYGLTRSRSDAQSLCHSKGRRHYTGQLGDKHWNWKGGRQKHEGYILVYAPGHPRGQKSHYVLEHILVWEQANGKMLPEGWEVHHFNGIGDDNRPENLFALPSRQHRQVIKVMLKRVRELEAQIKELKEALSGKRLLV